MASLARVVDSSISRTLPTVVGLLVDKSYSMIDVQDVVRKSLSTLVENQQKLKGQDTSLVLAEFSHYYQKILDQDIQTINKDSFYNYIPSGGTCIYDAIGSMTTDMEDKIEGMEKKPKRVVVGIVTDGMDNGRDSGCRMTVEDAKRTIEKMQKKGWEYLFFGAMSNTEQLAKDLGIPESLAATFNDNFKGSFDLLGDKITQARKGKKLEITADEKKTLALPMKAEL